MNQVLESRYSELIHRLVWGLEIRDAVRNRATNDAKVRLERTGPLVPAFDDHGNGRFSLTLRPGLPSVLRWVVDSPQQMNVPRRFTVDLATQADLDVPALQDVDARMLRIGRAVSVFPGSRYPTTTGSTVVRGRVTRNGSPQRWARIEIRIPALSPNLLARAHSDGDGEFHAVIGPIPDSFVIPTDAVGELSVFAPDVAPDRTVLDPETLDPLWDLPVEALPAAGDPRPADVDAVPVDDVADGTSLPPDYRISAGGLVSFPIRIGTVTALRAATSFS